jgi:predicted PurR-regulated permease PerM
MTDRWRWGGRIATGIGITLALLLIYQLRTLVLLILVAFLLAYVLDPPVSRLARVLGGRGRAIAGVAVLLCGALAALGAILGPRGLLFAVPAAAVLRVLIPELWTLLRQAQADG